MLVEVIILISGAFTEVKIFFPVLQQLLSEEVPYISFALKDWNLIRHIGKYIVLYPRKQIWEKAHNQFFFQGLIEAGSDLEAVNKYLDQAGSKLKYRTYGETLFDILIAGGILSKYYWYPLVLFATDAVLVLVKLSLLIM